MTADVDLLTADRSRDEGLVDELVAVINAAYAIGEAGLWLDGWTRTNPTEIAEAIESGGMLAATRQARLVGAAYVRPLDEETADLGLVSTAPSSWGNGIGGELVHVAEDLVRSREMTTVQLEVLVPTEWVHPAKERLRAWYTRLGYRVIRSAPFDDIARHLAPQLATPCRFLIFHKTL
ncbi:MAG TPA: GNAT family N-acetyltransferase [Gaiella sp.]|jgi:GNAT superfamily N-acetyltransferase